MSKSDDIEFLGHIFGEVQFILETTNNLKEADFF